MQLNGRKRHGVPASLVELRRGEGAVVDTLDLPHDVAHRLMVLGFAPGVTVRYSRSAPGGDPRVFLVEGAEVALRKETAAHIRVKASA